MLKVKKIIAVTLLILLPLGLMTGCWDALDINEKSILTTICLDYKNGEVYFYVEMANISVNSSNGSNAPSSNNNKYVYVTSHGKTIALARENLDFELSKPTYLGTIRAVIFTEDFAKKFLVEYMYRIRADETFRKKMMVVTTKDNIEEILKMNNQKNLSAGFEIEGLITSLDDSGMTFTRTVERLIENLSDEYAGFLLPCIGIQGNQNILKGYSVIHGSIVNGFIPADQSRGIIYIKAQAPRFVYDIFYNNTDYSISVITQNRKIVPTYNNGKINYALSFKFKCEYLYGNKKSSVKLDDKINKELTKLLKKKLQYEITKAIQQAKYQFRCDYLQFDDIFRVNYPEIFEKLDWQKEFSNTTFTLNTDIELASTWIMDYENSSSK